MIYFTKGQTPANFARRLSDIYFLVTTAVFLLGNRVVHIGQIMPLQPRAEYFTKGQTPANSPKTSQSIILYRIKGIITYANYKL